MLALLDNIMWNCLSGPHTRFATGAGAVRRYAPGFSPIVGCAEPGHPDFATLASYSEVGDSFYIDIWSGAAPLGWRIDKEASMFKMVWDAPMPMADAAPDAILLKPEHASQALELARLTNPGPFGIRTPELGEYFGYFDGGRLIALAGERMCAGDLHEVSGICTHPDFQGRGFAKKLTLKLVRRQLLRGKTPFLHVMSHNSLARALYEKMGFRNYRETVVRVVARTQ
jgi:ribosomal protein S18 acetylase RimI-like enzyme